MKECVTENFEFREEEAWTPALLSVPADGTT